MGGAVRTAPRRFTNAVPLLFISIWRWVGAQGKGWRRDSVERRGRINAGFYQLAAHCNNWSRAVNGELSDLAGVVADERGVNYFWRRRACNCSIERPGIVILQLK